MKIKRRDYLAQVLLAGVLLVVASKEYRTAYLALLELGYANAAGETVYRDK